MQVRAAMDLILSLFIMWCGVVSCEPGADSGADMERMRENRRNFESSRVSSCKMLKKSAICSKKPNLVMVDLIPYKSEINVTDLLLNCCGPDTELQKTKVINNTDELTADILKDADIVYPVLATDDTEILYGYHFIPYIKPRKVVYLTVQSHGKFITFLKQLIPFIVVCILLAIIAGAIAWAIECRVNSDFPAPFVQGLFEGFWWAFVTMTTVGYGDLGVQTKLGKIFAVAWIMFGIVTFGLLTGELTTHIIELKSPQIDEMKNASVGVLRHRAYDTFVAARHGGKVEYNDNDGDLDFYSDTLELIEKLEDGRVDGILLDVYTLKHLIHVIHHEENPDYRHVSTPRWERVKKFFLKETILHQRHTRYEGTVHTYGILIKNKEDYLFFKNTIAESRLRNELTWDYEWNKMENLPLDAMEYYSKSYFIKAGITIACVIGIIFICGGVYEFRRRKREEIAKTDESQDVPLKIYS